MTDSTEARLRAELADCQGKLAIHAPSCAATIELQLTEDERKRCRDLLAEMYPDEDGLPEYDIADHVWMTLYKAGFEIMRRNVAPSSGEDDLATGSSS